MMDVEHPCKNKCSGYAQGALESTRKLRLELHTLIAENKSLEKKIQDFMSCCCSDCSRHNVKTVMLFEELLCLRSVLSEWEEDKSCYVQWMRAEELRELREA